MKQALYLGYEIDLKTLEINAPCRCYACDEGVKAGHFCCSYPPKDLVEVESAGRIHRSFSSGAWRWYAPSCVRQRKKC